MIFNAQNLVDDDLNGGKNKKNLEKGKGCIDQYLENLKAVMMLSKKNLVDLHAGHEGGDDLVAHEEAGAEAGEVGEGPGWLGNLPQVN